MPPSNDSRKPDKPAKPNEKAARGKPKAKAAAVAVAGAAAEAEKAWVPSDEAIWETYAANGEPFLSSLASFVLHGLVIMVIVMGLFALFSKAPPQEAVELDEVEIGGGGGGHVDGIDPNAPGNISRAQDETQSLTKPDTLTPFKDKPIDDPTIKANTTPTISDDVDPAEFIERQQSKTQKANLGPLLKDAMIGLTGKGRGGSGSGGGRGTGQGKGDGDGIGDGSGKTNLRGYRVLRWRLTIPTTSGEDYVRKLAALGMTLAVADPKGKLLVIKDPLQGGRSEREYTDAKSLKRVYFSDDDRDSCEQVGQFWGLDFTPIVLIGFMTPKFEEELVQKETGFRGRKEEDIKITVFEITFSGGKHVIKVREQTPKPGRK